MDYLEYSIFSEWEPDIRRFLIDISILDEFDADLAAWLTNRTDVEKLIGQALEMGNFIIENENGYEYIPEMKLLMRRCMEREYETEEKKRLYDRAGQYYESLEKFPQAMQMYEHCNDKEKISEVLIEKLERKFSGGT